MPARREYPRFVHLGPALTLWALSGATALYASSAWPAQTARQSTEIDAATRHEALQVLAQKLQERYVIAATATKLAAMIRQKDTSNAYGKISSGPELARALTSDLNAIAHDQHLGVGYLFAPIPAAAGLGAQPVGVIETLRELNGAIPEVRVLEGDIGYIRVDGLPPPPLSRDAFAAAFAFVHRTAALIIDCRTNQAGEGNAEALFMSYLGQGPPYVIATSTERDNGRVETFRTTDLGSRSYGTGKPVFLLTSRSTFSGGEFLAYTVQAFRRGLIVGERTSGGAHSTGGVPLAGNLVANIPYAQIVNPVTKSDWEGTGVKPDVPVSAASALLQAHLMAVRDVLAHANNPTWRANLLAVEAQLETVGAAGAVPMLPISELTGLYHTGAYTALGGALAPVTISVRNGKLIQRAEGAGDIALSRMIGNRFAREGEATGAITSFLMKDGTVEMLQEAPVAPPTLYVRAH